MTTLSRVTTLRLNSFLKLRPDLAAELAKASFSAPTTSRPLAKLLDFKAKSLGWSVAQRQAASLLLVARLSQTGSGDHQDPSDGDEDFQRDIVEFTRNLQNALESVSDPRWNWFMRSTPLTTDDILLHRDDHDNFVDDYGLSFFNRSVSRVNLDVSSNGADYYQLLDKYFSTSSSENDELLTAYLTPSSSSPISNECPYYLPASEGGHRRFVEDRWNYAPNNVPSDRRDGPSKDELLAIYHSLREGLPQLLDKNLDYDIFAEDVVLVNNWHGTGNVSAGIKNLVRRMALLRGVFSFYFIRAEMQLLKITMFDSDNVIRTRWRIEGAGWLGKWTPKIGTTSEVSGASTITIDGLGAFYVNNQGKIGRVEIDRVIPDETAVSKKPKPFTMALSALVGTGTWQPGSAHGATAINERGSFASSGIKEEKT